MPTAPDVPRVPIPPPLLFAAALGVGIGAHRVVPVAVAPAAALPVLRGVGLVLCLLSGVLAVSAFVALANSAWPVVLLVPAVAVVQRLAIVPEERTMAELFGDAYAQYQRTVRRWL